MVDRKDVASWLEGPNAQRPDADTDYPGRRLGMPQDGPGSVGRFGRRLVAIIIDWTLCQLIAYAWLGIRLGEGSSGSWWPLVIFGVENLLLLSTLGSTFGQRLLGLRLLSMSGGRATVLQVLSRTVLLLPRHPGPDLGPRPARAARQGRRHGRGPDLTEPAPAVNRPAPAPSDPYFDGAGQPVVQPAGVAVADDGRDDEHSSTVRSTPGPRRPAPRPARRPAGRSSRLPGVRRRYRRSARSSRRRRRSAQLSGGLRVYGAASRPYAIRSAQSTQSMNERGETAARAGDRARAAPRGSPSRSPR